MTHPSQLERTHFVVVGAGKYAAHAYHADHGVGSEAVEVAEGGHETVEVTLAAGVPCAGHVVLADGWDAP